MKEKRDFRYFVSIIAFSFAFISILAYFYLRSEGFVNLVNALFAVSLTAIIFSLSLTHFGLKRLSFDLVFWPSIVVYVLMIAWLVHLTGGPHSRMQSLFIFIIVAGAYFEGVKGGLVSVILSLIALSSVFLFEYFGFGYENFLNLPLTSHELLSSFYYNSTIFLLFAFLSAYVAEKLKKTGEELEKARVSSETILDSIPSGVLTVDKDGKVIYRNKGALDILTLREEKELIRRVLEDSKSQDRGEVEVCGKIIGFSTRNLPGGEIVVVFQDLTQVKKMEEERLNLERLALLGEFAANLAHEIRNPVTAINTALELLLRKKVTPAEDFLADIMKEAERLNRIATDFLSFSKVPAPQYLQLNIKSLVCEVIEEIEKLFPQKKLRLENRCEDFFILADHEQMRIALLNVVKNAVEALDAGGEIVVSCLDEKSYVKLFEGEEVIPSGYAGILVEDNGCGMDQNTLKKSRNVFFTTKRDGTGFGLSIVERIVRNHGGYLIISSKKGVGTKVLMVLRKHHGENNIHN